MRLKELLYELDNIPNINSGGCGVSALAIARKIRENYPSVKVQFANLDGGTHILVHYKGLFIDSEGVWESIEDLEYYSTDYILINENALVQMLNEPVWNTCFNRREWLPIIESDLGIPLADIDTFEDNRQYTSDWDFEDNYDNNYNYDNNDNW